MQTRQNLKGKKKKKKHANQTENRKYKANI